MAITQTQVSQLYVALLGRASEASGSTYWQTNYDTQEAAAAAMIGSADVEAYFGGALADNRAFVETIYLNTLNKTADGANGTIADASGIDYWTGLLDAGTSRAEMMVKFIEIATANGESGATESGKQFVNRVQVSDDAATKLTTTPTDYKTSLAFKTAANPNGALDVTADAATVTAAVASIENILTAAYDAALATYEAAVATYDAAKATAAASATAYDTAKAAADADTSSVDLATAAKTAADAYLTDANAAATAAAAVVTAAAALTAAAAKTPSLIDDATATIDSNNAAQAVVDADAVKTAADTAVAAATTALDAAQAAAASAAAIGDTKALALTADDIIFGTEKSDVYTADDGAYNTGDLIIDSHTNDHDTLTVTSSSAITATPTVVGIEDITFNIATTDLSAADVALNNVSASNVTINQLQAGAAATSDVTGVNNGVTVTFGTGITGATTVAQVADSNVVVNAGSSASVTSSGGTTGSITINGGATTTTAVGVSTTGTVTLKGDALTTLTATGATIVAETKAAGATVTLTGTAATTDTATVSIGATGTIANQATNVETVNISTSTTQNDANGDAIASVATFNTTAADTYNLTGDKSITLAGVASMFDGKTVTDSTTAGTTTLKITTSATSDLTKTAADVVDFGVAVSGDTYTVANGQALNMSVANTGTLTLDIDDNDANTTLTGSVSLSLGVATTNAIALDATASSDNITTLNVINDTVAQTGLVLTAGTDADVVLTGSKDVILAATSTAKSLDATGFTGNLTATAAASTIADIKAGSGDDSITLTTAETVTVDGGAGVDTLTSVSDNTKATFSNFEILQLTDNIDNQFLASQLTGSTMAVKGVSGNNADVVDFGTIAGSVDVSTMDFSKMIFDVNVTSVDVTIDGAADIDTSLALGTSFSITGSSIVDNIDISATTGTNTISTGAGADVIVGGTGVDTITAGEGTDTITGGAGDDVIDLTETTSAIDSINYATGTDGVDTITGFTSGTDTYNTDFAPTATNFTFTTQAADTTAALSQDLGATGVVEFTGVTAGADMTDEQTVIDAISNGTVDSLTASDLFMMVLNTGTTSYVYEVTLSGNDTTLTAADDAIVLVGTFVDTDLATGDII